MNSVVAPSNNEVIIGDKKLLLHKFYGRHAKWIQCSLANLDQYLKQNKESVHVHINPFLECFPSDCNDTLVRDAVYKLHCKGNSVTIQGRGNHISSHFDMLDRNDIVGFLVSSERDLKSAIRNISKLNDKCSTFIQFDNNVKLSLIIDTIQSFDGTNNYALFELDSRKLKAIENAAALCKRRLIIKEESFL